jgi:hypothetical protein
MSDWINTVYLNQPTDPNVDEFTRIVLTEWSGTVCPEDAQEQLFSWLHRDSNDPCNGARTLCNDLESDARRFYSAEALMVAAVNKYFPGHTEVKPVNDGLTIQGKNANGAVDWFVFTFTDHGYHLSLSLLEAKTNLRESKRRRR